MRHFFPLLLLGPLALTPARAFSQVSVDPRALPVPSPHSDSASPPAPPAPESKAAPAAREHKPAPRKSAAAKPEATKPEVPKPAATKPAATKPTTGTPGAPVVRLGTLPPPPPALPPVIPVPMRPPLPPTPAPVVADAVGSAQTLAPDDIPGEQDVGGLRITFGPGSADLNPATDTAVRGLAHGTPPGSRFSVAAYAAGIPEDPSTPRRTSLSRALAVRSVLIAEGVASERIFVRALGAAPASASPPDRADIAILPPVEGKGAAPQPAPAP